MFWAGDNEARKSLLVTIWIVGSHKSLPLPGGQPPPGKGERDSIDYSLMATPLKEATLMELEVATGVRSPCPSMENTST